MFVIYVNCGIQWILVTDYLSVICYSEQTLI
jgi:hypothetical protein